MSILEQTIEAAIKDRAPRLYASLRASGDLRETVRLEASKISSEAMDQTLEQRRLEKWDRLPPLDLESKMRVADRLNREALLQESVQQFSDETSPPSRG